LLIHISVNLNEIFRLGKKYLWTTPDRCPSCNGLRLWSHGYVQRYFDGYENALWIKRYRCPDCNSVHTLRPASHTGFIQASGFSVFFSLLIKITFNRWLPALCASRQRYWFRCFKQQICRKANIDFTDTNSMLNALVSRFSGSKLVASSWSDYLLIFFYLMALHLPFPETVYGPSP
jgi:hypothetical protein